MARVDGQDAGGAVSGCSGCAVEGDVLQEALPFSAPRNGDHPACEKLSDRGLRMSEVWTACDILIDRVAGLSKNSPMASSSNPTTNDCMAHRLQPGDIVADKYKVEHVLGRGGMGLVLAAEHMQLRERVALKFLTSKTDRDSASNERFMREARVTAKLRSEHAARVTDFGVLDDGTPFMVMEYLEGRDLKQELAAGGPMPVEVVVEYLVQACMGLAEAHARGIVHRDLKPSNLFLTHRPDGTPLIKIMDFGVSKMRDVDETDQELTREGTLLGSPKYMAPEQLRASGTVDARADVWSLGAIAYELLSGRPPFQAESTAALCFMVLSDHQPAPLVGEVPGVTEALQSVVFDCLERDLTKRVSDVATLVDRLADAVGNDALHDVAARIDGILEGTTRDHVAVHELASTGSYSARRRTRDVRSAATSATVPGTASVAAPQKKRVPMPFVVAGLVVTAAVGILVYRSTRASGEPVAEHAAQPPANQTPPSTASVATAPSAVPAVSNAAPPASTVVAAGSSAAEPVPAPPTTRHPKGPGPRGAPPTTTQEPPAPPPTSTATKKPSNPFDDRF